jgi:hypothetical protein
MITHCQDQPQSPNETSTLDETSREQFAQMIPDLQKQIAFRFRSIAPDLKEELSAEAMALAFEMFVSLVQRNKADKAAASPLASYACRHVKDGRRCGASLNIKDIDSHYCQQRKHVRKTSWYQRDSESEDWRELVVEDRHANPADIAVTRIDFRNWLESLSRLKRQIAETLAGGETTQAASKHFQVTEGRISQLRRELLDSWNTFQGIETSH